MTYWLTENSISLISFYSLRVNACFYKRKWLIRKQYSAARKLRKFITGFVRPEKAYIRLIFDINLCTKCSICHVGCPNSFTSIVC